MVQIPTKSISTLHFKRANVTWVLHIIKKYSVYQNSSKLFAPGMNFKDSIPSPHSWMNTCITRQNNIIHPFSYMQKINQER